MNSKKTLATLPILVLAATGCADGNAESSEDYPSQPIEVIVTFAAGGAVDIVARQVLPLVEDELQGADTQVINQPGAGGWVGWDELESSSADGYTLGYIATPNFMSGYLNPDMGRDNSLDDFTYIANQVTDPLVISVLPDEDRFDDLDSMVEYAQENTLTVTSTGVGGHQHIASLRFNQEHGTNLEAVHGDGASESMAQFLGGHIDLQFNTVGNIFQAYENGELQPIAVLSQERSEFLPDVPTAEEEGYGPIYGGSSRGIAAPADLPDDLLEILSDAFEIATQNDTYIEAMAQQGLAVDYMGPDEYRAFLEEEEAVIRETLGELGWDE